MNTSSEIFYLLFLTLTRRYVADDAYDITFDPTQPQYFVYAYGPMSGSTVTKHTQKTSILLQLGRTPAYNCPLRTLHFQEIPLTSKLRVAMVSWTQLKNVMAVHSVLTANVTPVTFLLHLLP